MQEGIIIQNQNLPNNIEDLAKFVLIGREKLTAVRANIRAIDKLQLAEDVREQKKEEAQMLAEALLDAEVRIGDLLKQIPKATKGNQYTGKMVSDSSVDNQKTKKQVVEELGFNQKQAERFETLSSNKEIVEQVKAEARENEDIPTRSRVLQLVKEKSKEEKQYEEECRELDKAHRIYCKINDAVYKPISVEITEENVGYWTENMSQDELEEEERNVEEIWKECYIESEYDCSNIGITKENKNRTYMLLKNEIIKLKKKKRD